MIHIGLICPATLGHLNPTLLLGKKLKELGYQVTYFGWIETKDITENKYELRHVAYLEKHRPDQFMANCIKDASELHGIESNKYTFDLWCENIRLSCDELAKLFKSEMVDLLIADHAMPEMSSICDFIKLPFITMCNAMVAQTNLFIPGDYYIGRYSKNPITLIRNVFKNLIYTFYAIPMVHEINKKRKDWGMKQLSNSSQLYSSIAVICQQTLDLEYPLNKLNRDFHYVGPFIDESISNEVIDISFSKELPLVYASFGTINTGKRWIYDLISKACQELDVNLVISLGRPLDDTDHQLKAENVKIFPFVNQIPLLKKSDLCITHSGMNTTMHCVFTGTPMIAIPLANEQPGIASRIQYSGSGLALNFDNLSKNSLKETILEVLNNRDYLENIKLYQRNCQKSGGLSKAVEIITDVVNDLNLRSDKMLKTFSN